VNPKPEVSVVGWDPQWPALARAEAGRVLEVAPAVEHVGSTAVPGLAAIPVIDLVVGVDAAERYAESVAAAIEGLGYRAAAPTESIGWAGIHLRREGSPPTDVWVVEAGGREWKGAIAVRDYLRANPDEASWYTRAKRRAAEGATTREEYAAGKRATMETLDTRARRWKAQHPRG
jgi:GrpB-like predicted nucleotidyltransferase (UPF0157 family)